MAARTEKDLSQHLDAIRADLQTLSETVSQLVADTAGIQAGLKRRMNAAARQASAAGEDILHEAHELGGEALHAAARTANAAMSGVETKIERNPLTAVLIALGFGLAVGFLSRK